jgi:hypothetical protein
MEFCYPLLNVWKRNGSQKLVKILLHQHNWDSSILCPFAKTRPTTYVETICLKTSKILQKLFKIFPKNNTTPSANSKIFSPSNVGKFQFLKCLIKNSKEDKLTLILN